MQATQNATRSNRPFPHHDAKTNRVPEYVYRIAILLAVILLIWTAA